MIEIKEITQSLQQQIHSFVKENWGSSVMVSRGKKHRLDQSPGFVALENGIIIGLITYNIEEREFEILSLDSLRENNGIGSRLLASAVRQARESNCRRIWLITSNDNLYAMGFYQKRGFDMIAIHAGAIDEARKIKPEIPAAASNGIPIRHEIEFEMNLTESSRNGQEFRM